MPIGSSESQILPFVAIGNLVVLSMAGDRWQRGWNIGMGILRSQHCHALPA